MRAFVRLSAAAATAVLLSVAPGLAQKSRPTIALLPFEFGSVQQWWSGNQDIGIGISDLIVDELLEDGSFRIIERKKLEAILGEQDFSNSNRAEPSAKTTAQLGKALGVKYLVVGSITKFGTEISSKGVSGGGFGSKFGIGSVGTSSGKANVAITARMVDTSTGEIMLSAKGDGTSKRSGLMLGGAGGGGGKAGGGMIDFGASNFHDTIIGEATEQAVKTLVAALIAKKDRLE